MKRFFKTRSYTNIMVVCFIFLMPLSAPGKEISVPSGINTIYEAVSIAQSGDIIVVDSGEYIENVVIDKSLTLKSKAGPKTTIIRGKDADKAVIRIENAKSVHVLGFSVLEAKRDAISIFNSYDCRIYGNILSNNDLGLSLKNSNNNVIENNIASYNREGIRLTASTFNTLNNNKVDLNSEKGIILIDSDKNRITNNTANSNYWNGITLLKSNGNFIAHNTAVKNTYAIILGDSQNNELSDNRTMRRLNLILPIFLVYIGISLYLIERKLFIRYYSPTSRRH